MTPSVARGTQDSEDFIEFDIDFLFRDRNAPHIEGRDGWVYLREVGGRRFLAFQTGMCELAALRSSLIRSPPQFQSAHPLIKSVIAALGGKLIAASIDGLSEPNGAFSAKLQLGIGDAIVVVELLARATQRHLPVLADVPLLVRKEILARQEMGHH